MSSTVNITEAQANLPALVKRDSFTICNRGRPVGVFLSADRIAALVETLELLADSGFQKALKDHEAGRQKVTSLAEAEKSWTDEEPSQPRNPRRRVRRQPGS
jgi:PHD/YefM family antitoxin component YafN of YafNO toxin-antitoxin module